MLSDNDPDVLAKNIADKYAKGDALIKSVRFDNRCYNLKCIDGLTKSPNHHAVEDQRKGAHREYTVFATGVFKRTEKPSPYAPLSPEKIAKKKKKRSTFQATSLVTPDAQIPVFGHSKDRADKLVGYIFDPYDALINRMFIYDGGTLRRPYEFDTYDAAMEYYNSRTNTDNPILFADLKKFKEAISTQKDKWNEVLARIRWNVDSSAIGIFSDTFEARCIAQLYANQLKNRLQEQYKELNKPWDESYEVPIIYYIPGNEKNWQPYTQQEQLADRKQAQLICQDEALFKKASEENNYEFLLLLNEPDKIFNLTAPGSSTPILIDLLYRGELQLVESLLYRTNAKEEEILKFFREKVTPDTKLATIDGLYKNEGTPLHLAAEINHSTLKYFLVNENLDLNIPNRLKRTPLMCAVRENKIEVIKTLLADKRVNVNAVVDKIAGTAIFTALYNNQIEAMKVLLADPRVDVNAVNSTGETLLMLAIQKERPDVVKILLSHEHIDVNIYDKPKTDRNELQGKFTPLMWAIEKGNIEIVKALLTHKQIDLNIINNRQRTPLSLAIDMNHTEIVKVLLADERLKISVDPYDMLHKGNILGWAVARNQIEIVKNMLADEQTDVNTMFYDNKKSMSPLIWAVEKENIEIVKILLSDKRIDINILDEKGNTALSLAKKKNNMDIVDAIEARSQTLSNKI